MSAPIAVIDLGSHSALLLIAHYDGQKLRVLQEEFVVTRLGQGIQQDGKLTEDRQQQALEVLRRFKKQALNAGCKTVALIGTEALRRATNRLAFSKRIKQQLGLTLKVLSPEEEARFAYLGAISAFKPVEHRAFTVIDVGGNSTEITSGHGQQVQKHVSLPIGAARLAEASQFKVRLTETDRQDLFEAIEIQLGQTAFGKQTQLTGVVVGTGGTITTVAAIKHKMQHYEAHKIDQTVLSRKEMENLFDLINGLTLEERKTLKGLEPGREDVLPYGMLIYLYLMKRWQISEIRVSSRGLRYGYLWALINGKH